VQLHCALCHCVAAALCIALWQFCNAKGCHGVSLQAAALFFVPQCCTSCHDPVLCTVALCFMPQLCVSCNGVMLRGSALCVMSGVLLCAADIALHAADIALRAAALAMALHGPVTAPHVQPLRHLLLLRKWRNNLPAALVTVFVGGFLMPRGSVGTTLKIKINLRHWGECLSNCGPSTCVINKF